VSELVGAVLTRPTVDPEQAGAILADGWGIAGSLRPLPSERDRNWAVAVDGDDRYVLKVSNATEDPAFLGLQHAAMARLAAAGVPCQLPVPTPDGRDLLSVRPDPAGPPLLVRVLTWLPGRPLATTAPADRSPALLVDLGRVLGRTARALDGFDHPAAHRPFQWEAGRGLSVIAAHAGAVADPRRAHLLATWQRRLAPLGSSLAGLRHGVIHNDANDHNILVDEAATRITGLLDLGDAVWSVVANELAVGAAYAALEADDPLAVVAAIRSGFEMELPLADPEREVLPELVALRLATSVALSAHQSRLDPDDPYLTISEAPAWALLERLAAVEPAAAAARVADQP
jgi:Ser/Thr protein kinase RdoA (MazF antagonist)